MSSPKIWPEHTREAEILVVAAGVPGLIKKEMVKSGAYVFDVGINRVGDKTVGDVDYDQVSKVCSGYNARTGRRRAAHCSHAALAKRCRRPRIRVRNQNEPMD